MNGLNGFDNEECLLNGDRLTLTPFMKSYIISTSWEEDKSPSQVLREVIELITSQTK